MRPRHKNKHIEAAIKYAESHGWRLVEAGKSAHIWGSLYCPLKARDGCKRGIYSTPRDPQNHANDIKRFVDDCPHKEEA